MGLSYHFTEQNLNNIFYKNALNTYMCITITYNDLKSITYNWTRTILTKDDTKIYYVNENNKIEISELIKYLLNIEIKSIREIEDHNNLRKLNIIVC